MKKTPHYIIVMERWGESNNHSYVTGISRNYNLATIMGIDHHYYRGGKYDHRLVKIDLREQNEYFIVQQFNYERKDLVLTVCYDQEGVEQVRQNKRNREFFEVEKFSLITELPEDSVKDCLRYMEMNLFTPEQQQIIKDNYEDYIRKHLDIN